MAKKERSSNIKAPSINIGGIFDRFHAVIFVVVVFGGLAVAVFMLSALLAGSSTPEGYVPPTTETSFDTEVIEKVEELQPLSQPPRAPELPNGRTDPF